MPARLNKTTKTDAKTKPTPLRARHAIARPAQLDKSKVEEVASLCRQLGIVEGRYSPDAKLVDTLLTPSPQRFQFICKMFQVFSPELEDELEEMEPPAKMTIEEARFHYVMEFCHDVGLFDDGDEQDLLKIKGELPDGEHLNFWLSMLRSSKIMVDSEGPGLNTEEIIAAAERLTQVCQICEELDPSPDAASLLSGALLEEIEEGTTQSASTAELLKWEDKLDSQMRVIDDFITEGDEDAELTVVEQETPPEALADDTTMVKIKLLRGNLKDLINTFLAMYDASLKNAVASSGSLAHQPRDELEAMLRTTAGHQDSLRDFVVDVRRVLQRLGALREAHLQKRPVAREMASDNSAVLALDLRPQQNYTSNFPGLRSILGDLTDVLANV